MVQRSSACLDRSAIIEAGNASALRVQLTLNGVDFVDELLDGQVRRESLYL